MLESCQAGFIFDGSPHQNVTCQNICIGQNSYSITGVPSIRIFFPKCPLYSMEKILSHLSILPTKNTQEFNNGKSKQGGTKYRPAPFCYLLYTPVCSCLLHTIELMVNIGSLGVTVTATRQILVGLFLGLYFFALSRFGSGTLFCIRSFIILEL